MLLMVPLWGQCCVRLMPCVGVLVLLLGCVSSVFCLRGVFLWCLFLLRLVVLQLSVVVLFVLGVVLLHVLLFFLMVVGFALLLRSLLLCACRLRRLAFFLIETKYLAKVRPTRWVWDLEDAMEFSDDTVMDACKWLVLMGVSFTVRQFTRV